LRPTSVSSSLSSFPFLSYAVGQLIFGVAQSDTRIVLGLVMHWVTLAGLVAVVVFWERLRLSAAGGGGQRFGHSALSLEKRSDS
jgi:hypothetical protein